MTSLTKKKKQIYTGAVTLVAIALLIAGYIFYTKIMDSKADPKIRKAQLKIRKIKTVEVEYSESQLLEIKSYGRVKSVGRFDLVSEVGGEILRNTQALQVGQRFKSGAVLLNVDNRIQALNLKAIKSDFIKLISSVLPDLKVDYPQDYEKWKNYFEIVDQDKKLPALPSMESGSIKSFIVNKNILKQFYTIQGEEVKLEKYTIRAPFDGVIEKVFVQEGSGINPGAKIASLASASKLEVEVPLSTEEISFVKLGSVAILKDEKSGKSFTGKVSRIGDVVQSNTQSINVYVSLASDVELYDGSYLSLTIQASKVNESFRIPRKAIKDHGVVFIYSEREVEKDSVKQIEGFVTMDTAEIVFSTPNYVLIKGIENKKHLIVESYLEKEGEFEIREELMTKDEYNWLVRDKK